MPHLKHVTCFRMLHCLWCRDIMCTPGSPWSPVYGWCLTRAGCNTSSASPGRSLLPSSIIIVFALVNSAVPHRGLGYLNETRSAAPLPVSTASTGLLCLLVGAHVHRGRSNTEVECIATTAHISHLVHDQRVFHLDPYMHMQADVARVMIHPGGKDGLG